jgi:hypothetical protein
MADHNWPAPIGQPIPSIPLDIIVEIKQRFGSVYVEDRLPLPNIGLSLSLSADEVWVYAYYQPNQGLAIPFDSYSISGDIVPIKRTATISSYTQRIADVNMPYVWQPAVGVMYPIPPFSEEYRVSGTCFGVLIFTDYLLVGTLGTFVETDGCLEWYSIDPLFALWMVQVNGIPYGLNAASITISFR